MQIVSKVSLPVGANFRSLYVIFAWVGYFVWVSLPDFTLTRGIIGEIESILCFAVLVLTPLELSFARSVDRFGRISILYVWMLRLYAPAALGVIVSFVVLQTPGSDETLAALCILPWLVLTLLSALHAARRLTARGTTPIAEMVFDLGWIYWPVGAIWLAASRYGYELMGFPGKIVILTAVHFHFAGLAAPVIVGLVGRYLEYDAPGGDSKRDRATRRGPSRVYRVAAILVALGIPLTAVGIAASPLVELLAAASVATGLVLTMSLVVIRLIPRVFSLDIPAFARGAAVIFLAVAAGSVFVSMWFALRFATGEYIAENLAAYLPGPLAELPGPVGVPIDAMVLRHGWWNALGFTGCGLIAFAILRPRSRRFPAGIPFSRLSARGRVGRDFFERNGLIDVRDAQPTGLVDDLQFYSGPEFSATRLHPMIREFYERTADFELSVRPFWKPFMRPAAWIYHRYISSRLEQMNFPLQNKTTGNAREEMTSRILPIRDAADGRSGARAWVRHYNDSGKAIYAAAYASHRYLHRTFMNIAFPIPGGNITSVLRLDHLTEAGDAGGLALTSRPHPDAPGDEGVYFANRWWPLRLPINETIFVYARGMSGARDINCTDGGDLTARHRMWLFGVVFLELEYCIRRRG